jgi:hypothetical protein
VAGTHLPTSLGEVPMTLWGSGRGACSQGWVTPSIQGRVTPSIQGQYMGLAGIFACNLHNLEGTLSGLSIFSGVRVRKSLRD